MGDPLGSSHVSSQKQNREGVVGPQSGQYRATVVEWARDVVDPRSGCDRTSPHQLRPWTVSPPKQDPMQTNEECKSYSHDERSHQDHMGSSSLGGSHEGVA
ncbi:unnamed protein product [Malus baccata var. baccata]